MEAFPNIVSYNTQLVLGTLSGDAGEVDVYGEYTHIISPEGDESVSMRLLDGGVSIEELQKRAIQNVESRLNIDRVLQDVKGALSVKLEPLSRSAAYFPPPVKPTFTTAVLPLIYTSFRKDLPAKPKVFRVSTHWETAACQQGCLIDTAINKSIAQAEHAIRLWEINTLNVGGIVLCQLLTYRPASAVCGIALDAAVGLLIAESEEWRDERFALFDEFCLNCFYHCG